MSKDNVRRFVLSFVWFAKWVLAPLILGALLIAGGVALYEQRIDFDTFLNYFALGLLIFVVITRPAPRDRPESIWLASTRSVSIG